MSDTDMDCSLADTRTIEQLVKLDGYLKRKAEQALDHSRRHPEDSDAAIRECGDLIERARGVRMAIELVRGGKFLMGILIPASTVNETAQLVASRTENVECPVCGGIRPRCGEHPNDDPGMVCSPGNVDTP